jgi:UPF0271 protein
MTYVLDTSALLSGKPLPPAGDCIVPPAVASEVQHGRVRNALEFLLEAGARVASPGKEALERVRKKASGTGDENRVSPADIEALALALEMKGVLLTDDYSMQNLARVLGIEYAALSQDGIKEVWAWARRCRGCGKEWPSGVNECPDCGSEVKTVRRRS